MALKMVALIRKASGAYVARKGIPSDVRKAHRALYGSGRETKFYAGAGTPIEEVRLRFARWECEAEERINTLRKDARGEGRSITHREAHELAGDWYAWFIAQWEDEPGKTFDWEMALQLYAEAHQRYLPEGLDPEEVDEFLSTDARARQHIRSVIADSGQTAQFLYERRVVLTPQARHKFLDALAPEYASAVRVLGKRAEGDYTPDDRALRHPKARSKKLSGLTCWQLFEAWIRERQPKPATVDRWRGVFLHLKAHFGDRDIASITSEDVVGWKDTLLTPERSGKTINEVWLNAGRTIFGYAVTNKKITAGNPFSGVRAAYAEPPRNRASPTFSKPEVLTILRASLKGAKGRLSKHYRAARRWVPMLCAYTGARSGEITQLRGKDVVEIDGVWAICIKPDAGTQKKSEARTVPIHEHLIEQGFLEFVRKAGAGPLFYDAEAQAAQRAVDPTNPPKHLAVKCREHLAKWVRDIGVTDLEIAPNHSWRHLFKAIADECGIPEKVSDAITGHGARSVARRYGRPSLELMAKEIKKFPRFDIAETDLAVSM